jgi:hypothetical protein
LNDLLRSILDTITDVDQVAVDNAKKMKEDSIKVAEVEKVKKDSIAAAIAKSEVKTPDVKTEIKKDPIETKVIDATSVAVKEPKVKEPKVKKDNPKVKENNTITPDQLVSSTKIAEEVLDPNCGEIAAKVDFSVFKGKSLNDPELYRKFIDMMGPACISNMDFRVQIGAYRQPQNFKYNSVKMYGPADIKDFPDGITRFTIQDYKTIKQADKLRQKVIDRGIKDAWITAVVDGKRYTLEELINIDFFTKAIN